MELITVLIPIVVGAATTWLFDRFKQGLALLDDAPAVVKQIAVAVLAFGLTQLAALLGITLSTHDIAGLTPTDISTILSALIAYLLHSGKQNTAIMEQNVAIMSRRGASRLGLLVMLSTVGLGACVLGAWTNGSGIELRRSVPAVALSVDVRADSVIATATCGDQAWRAATAVSTCEWTVTRNGVAVSPAPANGFTARVAHGGAAGVSATYVISARGRNPAGDVGPFGSASKVLTVGYPPITAPVITVTVVP